MPNTRLSIGIDVGATKTSLLAHSTRQEQRIEIAGPPANPKQVGLDRTTDVLLNLIEKAIGTGSSAERLTICAGVAGAGRRKDRVALTERLSSALEERASALRVEVVHDALIALETAFGPDSGIVIIAGTGSVCVGRTNKGTRERVGGWGPLLGDPGSGYAIGRAGLRAVAQAFEGGSNTPLRDRVKQRFGVADRTALIKAVYEDSLSLQDVAPLVCRTAAADDPIAERILDRQTNRLARQVEWLVARSASITPRLALLGGMIQNELYTETLRAALLDRFPEWSVEPIREPPVVGALRRARRLDAEATE